METDEKRVREIVREELLGIIKDGQEALSLMKDPTGMGRKALEGLANLIRRRQAAEGSETPGQG
jgi:hypothetical protein